MAGEHGVGAYDPITRYLYVAAEELCDESLEPYGHNPYLLAAVLYERWRAGNPEAGPGPRGVVFLEPTYDLGGIEDD
jgi:hypothetical protein